jgi:hypothetical protein
LRLRDSIFGQLPSSESSFVTHPCEGLTDISEVCFLHGQKSRRDMIRIKFSETIDARFDLCDVFDVRERERSQIVVPPYPMGVLVSDAQAAPHGLDQI